MKYIVVSILDEEVVFIAQCKTERGAERSAAYSRRLYKGSKVETRILSVAEILAWSDSGVAELEAMYRL